MGEPTRLRWGQGLRGLAIMLLRRALASPVVSPTLQLVRHMSRVGQLPIKVPPEVKITIAPIDPSNLPPSPKYSKQRTKHHLRRGPKTDSFVAFGTPSRVTFEGPLGTLAVPIHSFCSVLQPSPESLAVAVQCEGKTKMGKTLWGTTRGHLANAIRGVTQGWRKELELHGIGFKARVPRREARRPQESSRCANGSASKNTVIRPHKTQALQSRRTCRAAGP